MSERDATRCFSWSRMCVADVSTELGRARDVGLPFEGFLEALVRVACLKALPTDDEVAASGFANACEYLEHLKTNEPDAYNSLLDERSAEWGDTPDQPTDRCVYHLLSIVITNIEGNSEGTDDLSLTPAEISSWMKRVGGGGGK